MTHDEFNMEEDIIDPMQNFFDEIGFHRSKEVDHEITHAQHIKH